MSKETDEPAFPAERNLTQGMTLRDYFAAKAMQGLITSRHTDYENGWYDEERLASSAYQMADAMLEARK
jgi:hypothetical protein